MDLKNLSKIIPYKWRVQSATPKKCRCVAYIDARDVMELLDNEIGPENWQDRYKEVSGNVYCGIGICFPANTETLEPAKWVWKWDCGKESKIEKEKGEASDAFKRAAVKWKIGRFLYKLDMQDIKSREYNGKFYPDIPQGTDLTDYINNSLDVNLRKRIGAINTIEKAIECEKYLKEKYVGEQLDDLLEDLQDTKDLKGLN